MITFESDNKHEAPIAKIKVLGVGGGGCNIINDMIKSGYEDIEFIAVNTDAQTLKLSLAQTKIQIGSKVSKGQGAGANPEKGRKAAEEDIERIVVELQDADIVFLTAGLGGGTGSGALPVIAQAIKQLDILSIAVITKPFVFEGKRRMDSATKALEQLQGVVDSIIVLPNQKLVKMVDSRVPLLDAFGKINTILNHFVKTITDIIVKPGHINVDFADIKTIMKDQGYAVIGSAMASGPDRALKASQEALALPLLENFDIKGARGVLLNITGNSQLGLHELSEAASYVYEQAHEDANIILGSVIDESMQDEIIVSIIATGFDKPASWIHASAAKITQIKVREAQELYDSMVVDGDAKNAIDLDNIDIPTVMRRMIQQQQK